MTQTNRPPHRPAPAAPRIQAKAPDTSWALGPGMEPLSREELLARYRRQRAAPQDPFESLGTDSSRETATLHRTPPEAAAPKAAPRRTLSMGHTFAIAAAMALAAGAGAGMVNARLFPTAESPSPKAMGSPAPVQAVATPPAAQVTEITKKPVPTATLEVADVAGETNSFIPLALRAEPAETGSDILLKISGIPEGAYLTSGRKQDDEIWAVTRSELKNLKLVVPEAESKRIDLAVAAFEHRTGELAAPVKTMTVALSDVVVQPAAAPPPNQTQTKSRTPAQTTPIPTPDSVSLALTPSADIATARELVRQGDLALKSGDVRQARLSYEKAWSGGSPAGAYGMARSFDPVVLGSLALKNDKPDKAQALAWYERAATSGHMGAADSIVRLRLKP
jgi:hypothetical protein